MYLSTEEINTILKQHLEGNEFEFVSCERIQDKGLGAIGFLSVQTQLCVKYKTGGHIEELHLFLKSMPESEFHKNTIISSGAFTKEVDVYAYLLKDMKKKMEGNPIPTCYFLRDNDKIVLTDLFQLGFRNIPVLDTFTLDHCEKAIDAIIKMHTSALVVELKNNCKLTDYLPVLNNEILFSKDVTHSGRLAIKCGLRVLKEVKYKFLPEYSEELTNKVFDYLDNICDLIGPSLKYPNVFSHSDLWSNNLMFSYDEENNVKECCLVDFQLAAVRPLPFDLIFLIHCCTDKETRDTYYEHLIKYYYDNLTKSLSSENLDLSEILPWREYENLVKEIKPLGLALAPQYLHFVLMPDDIIRDVITDNEKYSSYFAQERAPYVFKAATEFPAYKSRVVTSLIDVFEYFKEA